MEKTQVMYKSDATVLIDQVKQYVKSEKQIFSFTSKRSFPQPGKVGNIYLDMTEKTIWVYDTEAGYIQFTQDYIKNNDGILINCLGADDIIID